MRPRRFSLTGALAPAAALLALGAAAPVRAGGDHLEPAGPLSVESTQQDSVRYSLQVTNNNLVGVTITNYGFVGNNFISRSPSLEYPLGSGFEHLVRGGLWIGGRAVDDSGTFIGVVTAAIDGSQGASSQGATEFTPAGREIRIRSTLINNKFYNPKAVSELDLTSEFSDKPAKRVANNSEDHRPMSILVRQDNYMWSFADYQHLVIFHYTVRNLGPPIANAWVGFYGEYSSGPKNSYSCWPPSSTCSTVGSWFSKKLIAYDDSLRLFREHYCFSAGTCVPERVPYWIGLKLLGVKPGNVADTSDKKVTFAAWGYAPGSTIRDQDTERYAIMSSGRIQPIVGDSLMPESGDPVELLAVGPFAQINPGDSISVDFAIVGGADVPGIQTHSRFAQRAYDRNYIVPVPPPSPRMHVVARDQALDLYWDDSPESVIDPTSPIPQDFEGYRVHVGQDRLDLKLVGQFDLATAPHDTTGFNTGFSAIRLATPAVFDGHAYQYRTTIPALKNGFKYFVAVTSYDLGSTEIESLESGIAQNKSEAIPAPGKGERPGLGVTVFPNPYRVEARWDQGQRVRDHYLWFANLPERCTLKIFTLSGDLVFQTEFDGSTYHGEDARGIYDPKTQLDVPPPTLSGRTYGWNLITRQGQAAATGLYIYSVEPRGGGKAQIGKFLVVKSDREEL